MPPLPGGRSYGVFAGNVAMQSGDFFLESAQDLIIAHAGGGQAGAYQLATQTSRITTVATVGDSVQLPPSAPGLEVLVINHGANAMQMYGNGTDTIDDQATATGVSQMANSLVIYTCAAAGAWYSEGLATGFAKNLGLQTLSNANIAANATATQASGTPITALANTVSSAGAAYSVTLPPSTPGLSIFIALTSATNTVAVFPNAGGTTTEQINALSANAAITMAALSSATFLCTVAGQWWTVPRVPS
jgi:hypothetical protein